MYPRFVKKSLCRLTRLTLGVCLLSSGWRKSLLEDEILASLKLKAFPDHNFKVAEMVQSYFDRVEMIVGK